MKNIMVKVVSLIIMFNIFVAIIVSLVISHTVQVPKNGWVLEKGNRYYYENGKMKTDCWVKTPTGHRYYFDQNGKIKTGWIQIGQDRYYSSENGKMKTGWIQVGTPWYYLGEDGKMKTGVLKLGNKYYNLNKDGRLFIGWQYIDSDFGRYLTEEQKYIFISNYITALKFDKHGDIQSYIENGKEKNIYGNKTMELENFINDLKLISVLNY
ncbi:hypothetical protein [Bacillus mycoides]|nr:hypothetical protein [Bacillus mycoides]